MFVNNYPNFAFRGYSGKKLEDNVQCEIFQTILEEAQSSYDSQIVHQLQNDTEAQLLENIKHVITWIKTWKKNNVK